MTGRDSRNVAAIEAVLERRAQRRRLVRFGKCVALLLFGVLVGAWIAVVFQ